MHLCGDSADEADFALERSGLSIEEAYASARAANATSAKLQELAQAWQLDVCSIAPEGQRVCALPQLWLEASNRAYVAATQVGFQADKLVEMSEGLSAIQSEAKVAGESINASLASSLELATKAVLDASAKAKGTATGVNVTLVGLGGPITKEAFADSMSVFKQLSNASAKWHAVCALEPIKGEAYAALTDDSPAPCASRCLSLSSGLSACAAFNYQYKDGLAACQLLSATGLVQPLLLKAVPVFEVSETKRDAMGLASLGCYASGGFLAGHPQGPLGVKVVRQVVVH